MNNKISNFNFKNWQIMLTCLLISFLFLMICSNNSFLYAFNDNQDVNWYITMGNGMLNNKVPYRDLFEHKGPIVYFVFAFFCLFPNPYRIVFIFEILCFSLFLFFSFKILKKFISSSTSLISLIIIAFLTLTSTFFVVGGGAVEEFLLPILAYMLLCLLEFVHDKKPFSRFRSLTWGILIGVVLFVKFTLLLFPAISLVILCISLIKEKNVKAIFRMGGGYTFRHSHCSSSNLLILLP